MLKNVEETKRRLKEAMEQEIDRYFEDLEEGSKDLDCDINGFEKKMEENHKRTMELLNSATSEVLEDVAAVVDKKNVLDARDT